MLLWRAQVNNWEETCRATMQDSRVGEVLALADSKLKANGKLEQRRGKGGQALSLFRSTTTKMPR